MATTVADESKLPLWAQRIIRSLRLHIAKMEKRQEWLRVEEEPRYVLYEGTCHAPTTEIVCTVLPSGKRPRNGTAG
jgi:hypothetical protein